MFSAFVRTGAP